MFAACGAFAATPRAIPVIEPVVGSISGFIAVIPAEPPQELIRLAADCVTEFDSFRAPLTDAGRARRNLSKLTPTQRKHLDRWGYPYVMDDFRFHMTLTGRLGSERREAVLVMLKARFAPLDFATLAIDRIAVFRQGSAASRFRIVGEWELRGADAGGVTGSSENGSCAGRMRVASPPKRLQRLEQGRRDLPFWL